MGKLEESGRRRIKRRNLKKGILEAVQAAALLGVAIAAPSVDGELYKLGLIRLGGNDASPIVRARRQLIESGCLKKNERGLLRLTTKGSALLHRMALAETVKIKPHRWDGLWRVLLFDVPEYRKATRDRIRRTLLAIGFVRLQDSVWIYPYDCEDFIVLLKADFKIGKDVLYMIVAELEGDEWIREAFSLSSKK